MKGQHISNLRHQLKEAKALNVRYKKTIRWLHFTLWVALVGWALTLLSGIALWQITDRPAPPPLRLMEPDFGWGYHRAN